MCCIDRLKSQPEAVVETSTTDVSAETFFEWELFSSRAGIPGIVTQIQSEVSA